MSGPLFVGERVPLMASRKGWMSPEIRVCTRKLGKVTAMAERGARAAKRRATHRQRA